ncbi:MAG: twin-arginine translocase TatA/TatE family subunit [Proteobacteria bacterium]|nr:MAG: twin-arginine translocase TatA/TatE family subunit [Pseudomonadota bacterium]
MPGFVELLYIIVILVIVFGFKRLPALGEALGRAVHNMRAGARSRSDIEVKALDENTSGSDSGPKPKS